MGCLTIKALSRECGANIRNGLSPDVYLIAFKDLSMNAAGETYSELNGLVNNIVLNASGAPKFVKWGTVLKGVSLKEDFKLNDNGSYDITKSLIFGINGIGGTESRIGLEALFGQPIVALVKLNYGGFIVLGLNGQFQLSTIGGTVDNGSNGRVVTLSGEDSVLIQAVDPTLVPLIIEN